MTSIGSGTPQGNTTWNVVMDSSVKGQLSTGVSDGPVIYPVLTLPDESRHSIEINKRTEALFGVVQVMEFQLVGSNPQIISLPGDSTQFLFEFIGDSITCGYGIEGTSRTCPFTAETENNMKTYASLVSRSLGAFYHVEAWSGKGVVRNYGSPNTTSPDTMPVLMQRTIASKRALHLLIDKVLLF